MSRIDELLSQMTLAEKVGQLNLVTAGQAVTGPARSGDMIENIRAGNVGGVFNLWGKDNVARLQQCAIEESRLGAPLFFGLDVLHGHRTIFPAPLAEAGAFDPALWEETARIAAREAAADGIDLTFAPMLDISRDPRWGRIVEGPGEDPLVGALFARAKVRGFQGADLSASSAIGATAKHFCAGGAALAGRDYAAVDLSEREVRETYLPPFAAAVAAGCVAIMPAFNSLAGIPMTAHVALLRDYLRNELGFEGVIVSDYTAIMELIEHGVAADAVEAAALALRAGVDMDMVSGAYLRLPEAVSRGLAREADIDAAVRRVLRLKEKLGLFDDPHRRLKAVADAPDALRERARDAARRSAVLLTNDGVLPLPTHIRRLAAVGPLADARFDMLGPWCAAGESDNCVSILDGLRAALPHCEITHHQGVAIAGDDTSSIAAARALCAQSEAVLLCVGESAGMSGEAASRARPGLPGRQRDLAEAVLSAGVPVAMVLSSGRPLMVSDLVARAQATLASWWLGDMAGHAIADILTGRFNPTARLALTWPRAVGQIPIHYAARSSGRPPDPDNPFTSKYLDLPVEPLFHFGHGLSYAHVALSRLRPSADAIVFGAHVVVEVDATNEGAHPTEETIFLFLRDIVASVARPQMELKRFAKVCLAPGETKTVRFTLDDACFRYLDAALMPRLEDGAFEILAALSADRRTALTTIVTARHAAISDNA